MEANQKQDSLAPSEKSFLGLVLLLAAAYNFLWGIFVVTFPSAYFRMLEMPLPNYPVLWQCIGMFVFIYGIAYAYAAFDPVANYPIVLVGVIGKLAGMSGYIIMSSTGHIPRSLGWIILTNNIIWLPVFGWALYKLISVRSAQRLYAREKAQVDLPLDSYTSQQGKTIAELSQDRPLLLVFLRHFGCTFCRETAAEIAAARQEIESHARIAFVHMGSAKEADRFFKRYGLEDVHRFRDATCALYRAFNLKRGNFIELFGLPVWIRGFKVGVLGGHGVGAPTGDTFQMPGAFMIHKSQVVAGYRHSSASDLIDYVDFARTAFTGPDESLYTGGDFHIAQHNPS